MASRRLLPRAAPHTFLLCPLGLAKSNERMSGSADCLTRQHGHFAPLENDRTRAVQMVQCAIPMPCRTTATEQHSCSIYRTTTRCQFNSCAPLFAVTVHSFRFALLAHELLLLSNFHLARSLPRLVFCATTQAETRFCSFLIHSFIEASLDCT